MSSVLNSARKNNTIETLMKQISELEDIIKVKNKQIIEYEKAIEELEPVCDCRCCKQVENLQWGD